MSSGAGSADNLVDHEDLYERMKRSPKGDWGQVELGRLLRGYGFVEREGGSHRLYSHPKLPKVRLTIARHNDLAIGYVTQAVRAVDRLLDLEAQESKGQTEK